jgi:hypothetical protein
VGAVGSDHDPASDPRGIVPLSLDIASVSLPAALL